MLNALPSNTYVGFSDPLQNPINLHRTNEQILTNNFEQLHARSVKDISEDSGVSALKNAEDADKHERGRIKEFLANRSEPFRFEAVVSEGENKVRKERLISELKRSTAYVDAAYKTRVRDAASDVKQTVDVSI